MQSANYAPTRPLKHWNQYENKWKMVVLLWCDVIPRWGSQSMRVMEQGRSADYCFMHVTRRCESMFRLELSVGGTDGNKKHILGNGYQN